MAVRNGQDGYAHDWIHWRLRTTNRIDPMVLGCHRVCGSMEVCSTLSHGPPVTPAKVDSLSLAIVSLSRKERGPVCERPQFHK